MNKPAVIILAAFAVAAVVLAAAYGLRTVLDTTSAPIADTTVEQTQPAADEEGCKDLIRDELVKDEGEVQPVYGMGACNDFSYSEVDDLIDEVAEESGATGDDTVKLDETVTYEDDSEVSLSRFARGVSSPYAAPENAPYVRFTVKVVNGGDSMMDLSEMTALCQYGDDGHESEEIFDSERGLNGTPSTHLRPGRSASATVACELPKDETYGQVEVSPSLETETAVFAGDIE